METKQKGDRTSGETDLLSRIKHGSHAVVGRAADLLWRYACYSERLFKLILRAPACIESEAALENNGAFTRTDQKQGAGGTLDAVAA